MDKEIILDASFTSGDGPDNFGVIAVPFDDWHGGWVDRVCVPAKFATGLTMEIGGKWVGIYAYYAGPIGIYAPLDPKLCDELAIAFTNIAAELREKNGA